MPLILRGLRPPGLGAGGARPYRRRAAQPRVVRDDLDAGAGKISDHAAEGAAHIVVDRGESEVLAGDDAQQPTGPFRLRFELANGVPVTAVAGRAPGPGGDPPG